MRTPEELRGACRIVDGHWIYALSLRPNGAANVYAPNHTRGGRMETQAGPRAVQHLKTGKAIPNGWRAYARCDEKACCNPDHVACAPSAEVYARLARSGVLKGNPRRIVANRAINRQRCKVTAAQVQEIQASPEISACNSQSDTLLAVKILMSGRLRLREKRSHGS